MELNIIVTTCGRDGSAGFIILVIVQDFDLGSLSIDVAIIVVIYLNPQVLHLTLHVLNLSNL